MITNTNFFVRHTEIDHMGIVHHSNYTIWFETGRRDFLKKAGINTSKIHALGFFLPLSEMRCDYKSPARHKDDIWLTTSIMNMTCVKVQFNYKVQNHNNGKVLATGSTVHIWTNRSIEPINIKKEAPEIYTRLKQFVESTNIRHP